MRENTINTDDFIKEKDDLEMGKTRNKTVINIFNVLYIAIERVLSVQN